jgi:hypothetical protein
VQVELEHPAVSQSADTSIRKTLKTKRKNKK